MANEKAWHILWFCQTSGTGFPSLFEPYNLNHVSVFSVTLRLSCLPLASLPLTYPSRHHLIQGCWLINRNVHFPTDVASYPNLVCNFLHTKIYCFVLFFSIDVFVYIIYIYGCSFQLHYLVRVIRRSSPTTFTYLYGTILVHLIYCILHHIPVHHSSTHVCCYNNSIFVQRIIHMDAFSAAYPGFFKSTFLQENLLYI